MAPIERMNLKFSAGAVVVSLVVASPAFSWGVAGGAVLEAGNFHGLRRSAQSLFDGGALGGSSWVGVYGLRMVLLTVGSAALLRAGVHPLGLLLGLSLVMPAVLWHAWRTRPPVDPEAAALAPDDPAWKAWDPWLARERDEVDDT